jgi:ATP-dependent exoDNAse (exonuclease V) beta subunit
VTAKTEDAERDATRAAFISEADDGYDSSRGGDYIDLIMRAAAARGSADFYNISVAAASEITSGMANGTGFDVCEIDGSGELSVTQSELLERFDFKYPRDYLEKIPSKLTVSRLYPEILDEDAAALLAFSADDLEDAEVPRPSFMTGVRASAAERGSATHVFMQFADFDGLATHGAEAELSRLVSGGFMSEKMASLVDMRQIERFAHSTLMDKMRRAPLLEREFRFNVRMAASDFTEDVYLKEKLSAEGVKITVQGVVDAVFRDPDTGELVLVDYKTDRVTREEWNDASLADAAFRARHTNQLTYYKEICSRLFGEEIAVAEVYSTVLARCIEI